MTILKTGEEKINYLLLILDDITYYQIEVWLSLIIYYLCSLKNYLYYFLLCDWILLFLSKERRKNMCQLMKDKNIK